MGIQAGSRDGEQRDHEEDTAGHHPERDDARAAEVRLADPHAREDEAEQLAGCPDDRAENPPFEPPARDREDGECEGDDEPAEEERQAALRHRARRCEDAHQSAPP